MMKTVGQNIRICRKEKDLTQSELAEMLGVSVQAVSKWETDAGMPDISQIVPLTQVLEVSADRLLGLTNDVSEAELEAVRNEMGNDTWHMVEYNENEARRVYQVASTFFEKHPTCSEIAFRCLKSLAQIVARTPDFKEHDALMTEGDRYANCILRYETVADRLFRSYYALSWLYRSLGEDEKSDEVMGRIPETFGDKIYFEAELALANRDYEMALQKARESFKQKAQYVSRCIRVAAVACNQMDGDFKRALAYNQYMLRMINAFLSGGDYIPYRQAAQKFALIGGIINQAIYEKDYSMALEYAEQLVYFDREYSEFLSNAHQRDTLMLLKDEDDDDDENWYQWYVPNAIQTLKNIPELANDARLAHLIELA